MTKDTLTPPPSSSQELQDQVRGTGMQCDLPAVSTTYFEQTFQAIAQLALQNKFLELIRVAEQADLANSGDPDDPTRLFIVAPLVLAHLIMDDLPPAKHALIRLPESLLSIPLSAALRNLVTACWQRTYEQVHSNAVGLNDIICQAGFFDKDLANVLVHLVKTFIECFRRRTSLLLFEAYTSVPLPLAELYLGMNREQVLSAAQRERWNYDATEGVLSAPLSPKANPARTPSISILDRSANNGTPLSAAEMYVENNAANVDATISNSEPDERWITLQFTWSGKPFSLDVAESDRVFDLKAALQSLTDVPPERQKILGLVKGKLPPDQARITDLKLISGKKFTLVGTPEGAEIKDPSELDHLPGVVNDLDVDFSDNIEAAATYKNDQRNKRKIKEATTKLQLNIITPLRVGRKLLVLDIDYTILDTKPLISGSLPPAECARPGLHEFLETVYPYYDICIWSQTSWVWLETKLVELGMIGSNRNYHISFVLDKTSMFTVFTEREGKTWTHSVKALQIIWNHFPQFDASNTIHIDDLSRNFALNPKEGLKIQAFKNAHSAEALADRELDKLGKYLLHIANVPDFQTLSHRNWKQVVRSLPRT